MTTLIELFPDVAQEMIQYLARRGERRLAESVPELQVVDRCRCGDDFCAMVYTLPKPDGPYGDGLRNIHVEFMQGLVILDVVDDRIAGVEVLDWPGARERLLAICP